MLFHIVQAGNGLVANLQGSDKVARKEFIGVTQNGNVLRLHAQFLPTLENFGPLNMFSVQTPRSVTFVGVGSYLNAIRAKQLFHCIRVVQSQKGTLRKGLGTIGFDKDNGFKQSVHFGAGNVQNFPGFRRNEGAKVNFSLNSNGCRTIVVVGIVRIVGKSIPLTLDPWVFLVNPLSKLFEVFKGFLRNHANVEPLFGGNDGWSLRL
mmetsp:Transcript_17828/g.48480  ORF Transcript_17828/g.48480 Transcript_17828/m.48480 type:complete len:206 (+) Transcript_17828:1010-1627(+)